MNVTGFCRRLHRTWYIGGSAAFACLTLASSPVQGQIVQAIKASESTTALGFNFDVVNNTTASLSKIKVEYFLDPTGDASVVVPEVDYTTATSLTKSLVTLSPTSQEVVFDFGAQTLAAGAKITVNARLHLSGYQTMNNANDFSYAGLGAAMAQNNKMRLQVNGTPVFGTAPVVQPKRASVRILSPVSGSVTTLAEVPVRWTIDGVEQTRDNLEALQPGTDTIFRCGTDSCGVAIVTRRTQSSTYEVPNAGPSANELVSLLGATGIVLRDRTQIRGANVFTGGALVGGTNDIVEAVLQVKGALTFNLSPTVSGAYAVGGTATFGAGSIVDADKLSAVAAIPAIAAVETAPGGGTPVLDTAIPLAPGNYGTVVVAQNRVLVLQPGNYTFATLTVSPDSRIKISGAGAIDLLANHLTFGDRAKLVFATTGSVRGISIRTSQTEDLTIGTDSKLGGFVVAPNAKVWVKDRAAWNGTIQAKSIEIGSDAVVDGRIAVLPILAQAGGQMGSRGLRDLKVASNRGVLHISNAMFAAMKRVEVLPLWMDTGYTYLDKSGLSTSFSPLALDKIGPMSSLIDEEAKYSSFKKFVLLGSESVGGADCWKIRVWDFKSPWYLLAYFPEKELMTGSAILWINKSTGALSQFDLSITDGRPEITFDAMPAAIVGPETFRVTPGSCAVSSYFGATDTISHYRILVEGAGSRRPATTLSEVEFYSNGVRLSPTFAGPSSFVSGTQVGYSRALPSAWTLFNGSTIDDGFSDPSVLGELQVDLLAPNGLRVDEVRISGPTDPLAGPSGFKVQASVDGKTWYTVAEDTNLVWGSNEVKSRSVNYSRLARTCIPSTISVTVPGLAAKMDAATRSFFQTYNFRVPGPETNVIISDAAASIGTLPAGTDLEKQTKFALYTEYKHGILSRYLTLHYQVREAISNGGAGVVITESVAPEAITSHTFFRSGYDMSRPVP